MDELLHDVLPAGAAPMMLLSSDEFTRAARDADVALLKVARGTRIGAVFCADHGHAAMNLRNARRHFEPLGASVVEALGDHEPGSPPAVAREIDILYLAGGSPADLLACLRDSAAWEGVLGRWRTGTLALAGSSAGAMALCTHSLEPEPGADKPSTWSRGLGPIDRFGLAVHASSRPKEWLESIALAAPCPVIALDDGAALLLDADPTRGFPTLASARVLPFDAGRFR